MRKIIAIKHPIIDTYPNLASVLAVVSENTEKYLPWLYNKFVQVQIDKHPDSGLMMDYCMPNVWTSCPWINYENISREIVDGGFKSIIDFFITIIDNNKVGYFLIDMYYIPLYQKDEQEKIHMFHPVLLFGYDTDEKLFHIADNFSISNGRYSFQTCTFDELELAFYNTSRADDVVWTSENSVGSKVDWLQGIKLLSFNRLYDHGFHRFTHEYEWEFDLELFGFLMEDFIYSRDSAKRFTNPGIIYSKHYFGLDCLNFMMERIAKWESDRWLDLRGFSCINSYQENMSRRIAYMLEMKYLSNAELLAFSEQLKNRSSVLISQGIKYNLTKSGKLLEQIKTDFSDMIKDMAMLSINILKDL